MNNCLILYVAEHGTKKFDFSPPLRKKPWTKVALFGATLHHTFSTILRREIKNRVLFLYL